MDVITTKVNLVIEPVDGFTGERQLQGTVYARTNENAYAMKKDGCFVFFNKPAGSYRITVGGSCYQPLEFDAELDDSVKTMTVVLMPSRNYRFTQAATKLYGKAECSAKVCFIYDSEQCRILGEYKRGETKISAFFSEKNPMRPEQKYSIGKAGKSAVYSLKHLSGMEYELDRPLEHDADFDSAMGAVCDVSPSGRGEYFIAASGSFRTAEIICGKRHETLELISENTEYMIKEK